MKLSALLFNVQDLFIFMDKYQGEDLETMREPQWQMLSASFYPNKSLQKIFSIKQIILDADPDIIMLVEVGGRQTLENLNRHFLDDAYTVHFAPSNSDRGIDVGFLCKKRNKDVPDISFYLVNHSGAKLKNGMSFARGLLELRVLSQSKNKGKLAACFLLTHLKSKLDLKKQDFEGRGQRSAEVQHIIKHYRDLQRKHPKTPVAVCGDLNGIIYKEDTEEELLPFEKAGLFDVFELLDKDLKDRQTYFYFNKQQQRIPMQLDYILFPRKFKNMLLEKAKVLEMEPDLVPYPPETMAQKRKLPSDHYPVYCELKVEL